MCNVQRSQQEQRPSIWRLTLKTRGVRLLFVCHHSPIQQEMLSNICIITAFTNVTYSKSVRVSWQYSTLLLRINSFTSIPKAEKGYASVQFNLGIKENYVRSITPRTKCTSKCTDNVQFGKTGKGLKWSRIVEKIS